MAVILSTHVTLLLAGRATVYDMLRDSANSPQYEQMMSVLESSFA
jgi:hypothetical protein